MTPSMSAQGIASAIGGTPLVRLNNVLKGLRFSLYAKLEGLSPGGSIKDRAALSILRRGFETGEIRPGTVVIESSSGNMGIGLAQLCASMGLRFICVVDAKSTAQNIAILKAYGAEIDLIRDPDPATGEYLQARLDRVKALVQSVKNSFWPNQYANSYNAIAHHQTMREIAEALGGSVDYLFCATSTCGTIRGCAEYVREHGLGTRILAVDAIGSAIFGQQKARRLIPGHGASVVPALHRPELVDRCVHVSDVECILGCRLLVREEGILAGGSSGGALMAVHRLRSEIPDGANCVVIFPDRGERYLETIYSDAWVAKHFGELPALWESFENESKRCQVANS
jgi:2,3-diaminopropionate biosynthesis protein SbnA